MKTPARLNLIAGAITMLLATGNVWAAASSTGCSNSGGQASGCGGGGVAQAPEIDAAAGTSAIALLAGIVLLMKERTRSKRSSKSDNEKLPRRGGGDSFSRQIGYEGAGKPQGQSRRQCVGVRASAKPMIQLAMLSR